MKNHKKYWKENLKYLAILLLIWMNKLDKKYNLDT